MIWVERMIHWLGTSAGGADSIETTSRRVQTSSGGSGGSRRATGCGLDGGPVGEAPGPGFGLSEGWQEGPELLAVGDDRLAVEGAGGDVGGEVLGGEDLGADLAAGQAGVGGELVAELDAVVEAGGVSALDAEGGLDAFLLLAGEDEAEGSAPGAEGADGAGGHPDFDGGGGPGRSR